MNQSLQPVFSKSFPANNLLDLSLVQDTDPNLPFYKPKFFMFLSMTQGITSDTGQRTFDKNSRITIKVDSVKILALSNSIKAFARGAGQTLGQFQIFADSTKSSYNNGNAGSIKMAFISEFEQQTKNGTKKNIAISLKQGQNKPIGVFFVPAEALAIAEIFDFIAKKSLDLEFNNRTVNIGKVPEQIPNQQQQPQNQQQTQQQPQQQQQTQQQIPNQQVPEPTPFGNDDDFPF